MATPSEDSAKQRKHRVPTFKKISQSIKSMFNDVFALAKRGTSGIPRSSFGQVPLMNEIPQMFKGLLNHVIAWVKRGTSGLLRSSFGISGSTKKPLAKNLNDCATAEDFKKNVNKYIKEIKLDGFFPEDSKFLQKLSENLVAFKDRKTPLNTPENLKGLIKLSLYQTILYCDDSMSMGSPTIVGGNTPRIEAQREIVKRITRICSTLLPNDGGIHVRFINNQVNWDKLCEDRVHEKMATVRTLGSTNIGTNLRERILKPYIYDRLDMGQGLEQPYLICIITDGVPYPEDNERFANVLEECVDTLKKKGYGDRVVSFVVNQIGDDEDAKKFLEKLRGNLQLGDSVYVCKEQIDNRFTDFNRNDEELEIHLFNVLTAPLMQ